MKSRHYLVSGRVQGVGFRNFVFKCATALGLSGRVRNLRDGRVEILARGPNEVLVEFERAIAKGPLLANVADVESKFLSESDSQSAGFSKPGFSVTEDGAEPWSFNS